MSSDLSHDKRKLIKNIFSLFVLQGANYLLPLVTIPYLVRVLGPDKFGLIAFAQAFIQYFVIFTDYGFNLSATRQIAIDRCNSEKVAKIFSAVLLAKVGLLVISFFIMVIIVFTVPRFSSEKDVFYLTFLTVIGSVLFPVWFFQGIEDMKYITVANLVSRIVTTGAIFLIVKEQSDYLIAVGVQAAGGLIAGTIALFLVLIKYPHLFVLPSGRHVLEELKNGWYVFISTAAISLYTASNTFILGMIVNNTVVGYFSAADKIVRAVLGLLGPVSQSIYPHISAMAAVSRERAVNFIKLCMFRIGGSAFVVSLALYLSAEILVNILLGQQYQQSIALVRIMSFVPFIVALSNVFGVQTMLAFGMNKAFSRVLIIAGLINMTVIIPLTLLFNAYGTAVSFVFTELFVTVAMYITLVRNGVNILNGGVITEHV